MLSILYRYKILSESIIIEVKKVFTIFNVYIISKNGLIFFFPNYVRKQNDQVTFIPALNY